MGIVSTIVCKTAGAAGMSAVLYDAFCVGKSTSKKYAQNLEADHFEHVKAKSGTLEYNSPVNNAIQNKVSDIRMKLPVTEVYGRVKGACLGFFTSLGNNIIPAAFASLALAARGALSKIGALGLAGYGIYVVAKEGFGLGKHTPMD